jgi:hypothetical protein
MEYKQIILDAITGEITERPYTKEEIAESENNALLEAKALEQYEAEAQAKAEAKAALLAQLGITEEQAKLLLS